MVVQAEKIVTGFLLEMKETDTKINAGTGELSSR
jgi:hypothetical protein